MNISREEALKAVDDIFNYCEEIDYSIPENERSGYKILPDIHRIRKYIIENTSPHGEWIPCSERLPEESHDSVIGWDRFRERCVFVQYMDGHFQITGKQESFDIIAWMPLPEPYKAGDPDA